MLRLLFAVQVLLTLSQALPDYQTRLPNGYRVPHPCFANSIWKGVGHRNHEGGGFLNPFGEDFRNNGFQWDECLCNTDSDGDGMTNGAELGDPNCVWTMNELPENLEGLYHPGVCEPVDSEACQQRNTFDACKPIEFTCPGMENNETVEVEVRFSKITIPDEETVYYCLAVEFDDTDRHAFAMEPIVDNVNLVHHIDMYECPPGDQADAVLAAYPKPGTCGAMVGCGGNMLAAWALGIEGICLPENVGIRIGKFGARVAILRIHYHNPFLHEFQTDTSGLRFHMTPIIRDYDSQVLNLGQMYLAIPPGQVNVEASINCGSLCTNSFKEPIYLTFGAMHMHYLGTGGYSELWRDGQKVKDIMIQDFYDYNAPHLEVFHTPIKIEVGDTIRHKCQFQSRDRETWTYRGQSAFDEMCHIYFVYYPAQNLTQCFNNARIETCDYRFQGDVRQGLGECDMNAFRSDYDKFIKTAMSVCDASIDGQQCLPGCKDTIVWVKTNQTCLSQQEPDTYDYTLKTMGDPFRRQMHSCEEIPNPPYEEVTKRPIVCAESTRNNWNLLLLSITLITLLLKD